MSSNGYGLDIPLQNDSELEETRRYWKRKLGRARNGADRLTAKTLLDACRTEMQRRAEDASKGRPTNG